MVRNPQPTTFFSRIRLPPAFLTGAVPFQSRGRFPPVFAPVTDSFLPSRDRLLPEDPSRLLRRGEFVRVPVMTGIDASDGLLMLCESARVMAMFEKVRHCTIVSFLFGEATTNLN